MKKEQLNVIITQKPSSLPDKEEKALLSSGDKIEQEVEKQNRSKRKKCLIQ